MPERVTKEERTISLAIEKARDLKETLYQSLEGNRLPDKDDSEHIKIKRPKAENVDVEIKPDGKHSGLGLDSSAYAGDNFKKAEKSKVVDGETLDLGDLDEYLSRFKNDRESFSDNSRIRDFNIIRDEMKRAIRSVAKKHDLTFQEVKDMMNEFFG